MSDQITIRQTEPKTGDIWEYVDCWHISDTRREFPKIKSRILILNKVGPWQWDVLVIDEYGFHASGRDHIQNQRTHRYESQLVDHVLIARVEE